MSTEAEEAMSETAPPPFVVETTAENFIAEVVERSHLVPVVVDFWAEWCQPCRILGPVLEKLATEYQGRFVLAKADTEKLSDIASGFGVRSIPAVFAIRGGQVVDSFVGVLPEASIRAWLDRIMPTPAELLVMQAKELEPTDLEAARAKYLEAEVLAPKDPSAKIGLARVALGQDCVEEARAMLEQLERRGFLEPEAETLKAQLTLRGKSEAGGDLDSLLKEHEADPRDKSVQLKLAEALASAGRYEEALALALDLVETDRRRTGEPARKLMIAIFQLLPADSSLATDYRRRLSVAL
jgi:putative thioredoxin